MDLPILPSNWYRVNVVYFINPHLIWVDLQNSEEIVLEQVGVYGLLPLIDAIIDEDSSVLCKKSNTWSPQVVTVLQHFFADDGILYFKSMYGNERNTILNKSIHKFGDFKLVKSNKKYYLSELLQKKIYAYVNEGAFHRKLENGEIKTKLDYVCGHKVLNCIKQYYENLPGKNNWKKQLYAQTSLFQDSIQLGTTLTAENLAIHNRENSQCSVFEIIDNKTRDFNLCKGADSVSMGRAYRHRSVEQDDSNITNDRDNPMNSFLAVKKYIASLARNKPAESCKSPSSGPNMNVCNKNQNESELEQLNLQKNMGALKLNTPMVRKPLKKKPEYTPVFGPPTILHNHEIRKSSKSSGKIKRSSLLNIENIKDTSLEFTPKENLRHVTPELDFVENVDLNSSPKQNEMKLVNDVEKISYNKVATEVESVNSDRRFLQLILENKKKKEQCKIVSPPPSIKNDKSANSTIVSQPPSVKDDKSANSTIVSQPPSITDDKSSNNLFDEDISAIKAKLETEYKPFELVKPKINSLPQKTKRDVNPFKNLDGSKSVFVDKLVSPILMVHTKNDNLVLPQCNLRDIPLKNSIRSMLETMKIKAPNRLQSVSWSYILRGHSVFLIAGSEMGKTLGYVPAVCNLVMDSANDIDKVNPVCIIVCATSFTVSQVEEYCKRFLGIEERVLACFPGVDSLTLTTSILNGCDILVCTPSMLYRLLSLDFGISLRRLKTLVLEDCERLSEVYAMEVKYVIHQVQEMLKSRTDKALKVQYVVASRRWYDFIATLAKNSPDAIVAIGAFQECVLYSKAKTTVKFVLKENKYNTVIEFLKNIDSSKRAVVACRTDDEVTTLGTALIGLSQPVFTCDSTMTIEDLYKMNIDWGSYQEPVLGPILVCCDGNLSHLNVTNAHYLVHCSMPAKFSTFCKRFSVLNENYASIFEPRSDNVSIQILLDEDNVEQLPKILNFVKRCTGDFPSTLDDVSKEVFEQKELKKAKALVPICTTLMTLGECVDISNCNGRHSLFKEYDEPKEWMPRRGLISFKILSFDTAVSYSAKLISNVTNSKTVYPNTYQNLCLKMGRYFSLEENKKLHGLPKLGDICAYAKTSSTFVRCRVMKILNVKNGLARDLLINLIDEEQYECTRDVFLYHLPDAFKTVETYVVKVRLANIMPQDKDTTFSNLAKNHLKSIVDRDPNLLFRGKVVLTIGNCIFVDTLEAFQDLKSLRGTALKYDYRSELLKNHAVPHLEHIKMLSNLNGFCDLNLDQFDHNEDRTKVIPDNDETSYLDFEKEDDFKLNQFESSKATDSSDDKTISSENLQVSLIQSNNVSNENIEDESGNDSLNAFGDLNLKQIKDQMPEQCLNNDGANDKEQHIKVNELVSFKAPNLPESQNTIQEHLKQCLRKSSDVCMDSREHNSKNNSLNECVDMFLKNINNNKEETKGENVNKNSASHFDSVEAKDIKVNGSKHFNASSDENCRSESMQVSLIKPKSVSYENTESYWENNSYPAFKATWLKEEENIRYDTRNIIIKAVDDSDEEDDKWDVCFDNDIKKSMLPLLKPLAINADNLYPSTALKAIEQSKVDLNSSFSEDKTSVKTDETFSASDIESDSCELDSDDTNNKDDEYSNNVNNEVKVNEERLVYDSRSPSLIDEENAKQKKDDSLKKVSKLFRNSKTGDLDSVDVLSDASAMRNPKLELIESHLNSSPTVRETKNLDTNDSDASPSRKPKLVWRQNKNSVTVRIDLVGVKDYSLLIAERNLKFNATHNDTVYEFDLELYGVIDINKSRHVNKAQFIQIDLVKVIHRNWLTLTKACTLKQWIVYDVDWIEASSDEESVVDTDTLNVIKAELNKVDSDSDSDENYIDDANMRHKYNLQMED